VCGERARVSHVIEGQFVEPAAQTPEGGQAVEKARGEGIAGTDRVDDGHGRRWDGDARAVR
jgi:hypothetical protein